MKSDEEIAKMYGMTVKTGPQVDCPDCRGRLKVTASRSQVALWCDQCERRAQMMTKTLCLMQEAYLLGRQAIQTEARRVLGMGEP